MKKQSKGIADGGDKHGAVAIDIASVIAIAIALLNAQVVTHVEEHSERFLHRRHSVDSGRRVVGEHEIFVPTYLVGQGSWWRGGVGRSRLCFVSY